MNYVSAAAIRRVEFPKKGWSSPGTAIDRDWLKCFIIPVPSVCRQTALNTSQYNKKKIKTINIIVMLRLKGWSKGLQLKRKWIAASWCITDVRKCYNNNNNNSNNNNTFLMHSTQSPNAALKCTAWKQNNKVISSFKAQYRHEFSIRKVLVLVCYDLQTSRQFMFRWVFFYTFHLFHWWAC